MNPHDEHIDGPSEADIINLLTTYGDALERSAEVPAAPPSASGAASLAGPNVAEDSPEVLDLGVSSSSEPTPGRGRLLVGAVAAAAALIVGGFVIAGQSNDQSQVAAEDVAVEESEATDERADDDAASSEIAELEESEGFGEVSEADLVGPLEGNTFGFLGPNTVVATDDGFARLGIENGAPVLFRSADGINWLSEPVNGLPEESFVVGVAEADSGWVAVVDVFPESIGEVGFLGSSEVEQFIATSPDLINWTLEPFDQLFDDDTNSSFTSGVAASGDTIVALVHRQGPDEFSILAEAGLLNDDNFESFCGSEFEEGGPFIAFACESGPFGPEGGETELFRVLPGEPFYDELSDVFTTPFEELPAIAVTGPFGGPYEAVEFPAGTSFGSTVAATDSGFVVAFTDPVSAGVVLSSVDGITWSDPVTVFEDGSIDHLSVSGEQILAVGQSFDFSNDSGIVSFVSNDLGATWAQTQVPTELFNAFGLPVGGDAGFAIQLNGSTVSLEELGIEEGVEPFNPFGDRESFDVVVDGYTVTFGVIDGSATLTGPDGTVIHDNVSEDVIFAGGQENVVRIEGPFDNIFVWLDPITGEELVTVTGDDIEVVVNALLEAEAPDFDENLPPEAFEDPFADIPQIEEVWFSADGVEWTRLAVNEVNDDSFGFVAAVGDDEVLAGSETFVQPPPELLTFEFEGRPPTDEEIETLDAWWEENALAGGTVTWEILPVE